MDCHRFVSSAGAGTLQPRPPRGANWCQLAVKRKDRYVFAGSAPVEMALSEAGIPV